MTRKIEVVPYNPAWPQMFEEEAEHIKQALGENCIAIHHIGSTSVPGLCAKPKIDIIVVVKSMEYIIQDLEKINYEYRGEFNIPLHLGFRKRPPLTNVNLHVFEEGNPEIELNLLFRNFLRTHPEARQEYAKLKLVLANQESSYGITSAKVSTFNLGKDTFIKKILGQAGFKDLCLRFCTHHDEWDNYHRIRKEQIFDPINVTYDPHHPSLTMETHYHFVLYRGTTIVSVAHVELLNETEAALRSLATDEPFKNKGNGSYLMKLIEKWLKSQGRTIFKLHSNLRAESFYRKLGYGDMSFDDPCINPEFVNLGKEL
jgi:GrpB-like predicted nucleotidyltransferase (UPF0157 family)/GNAT superfamily N-acetyltransferase